MITWVAHFIFMILCSVLQSKCIARLVTWCTFDFLYLLFPKINIKRPFNKCISITDVQLAAGSVPSTLTMALVFFELADALSSSLAASPLHQQQYNDHLHSSPSFHDNTCLVITIAATRCMDSFNHKIVGQSFADKVSHLAHSISQEAEGLSISAR